jgi:putative oxidoreductase
MTIYRDLATLLLRLALAAGFLSAVASRLGLWGTYSSGWANFIAYTAQVNSFAPKRLIGPLALTATLMETLLGLLLLIGYQTSYAATAAALLTGVFGAAMSFSAGPKEPLDYSVWVFSAGAWLLATQPYYRWGVDSFITK